MLEHIKSFLNYKVVIISVFLIVIIFITFVIFQAPFSHLKINNENGNYLIYNNKTHSNLLNLKSGRNKIAIAGPKIYKEINIFSWPFMTKNLYISEEDNNISEEEIVNFVLNKQNIPDNELDMCKSFGYEWIICRGGLGSAESIAVHYSANNWEIVSEKGQILNTGAQQYYNYIIEISKAEGQSVVEK